MTRERGTQLAIRLTPGILGRVDHHAGGTMTRSAAVRELLTQALASPLTAAPCPRCGGLKDWQIKARATDERAYTAMQIVEAFSRSDGDMPFLCAAEVLELLEAS